jgi:hypothetical protein
MRILLKRHVIPAAVVAAAAATLLTGCNGGAQNLDPVGKNAGSQSGQTNPAQENKLPCTVVPDTVLHKLTTNSSKGAVAVAWAEKAPGDGWYVSGPVGDNTTFSAIQGLWATKGDIHSNAFDSPFYSLNRDAKEATTFSSTAPAGFSASSTAAKRALACTKAAKS